MVRRAWWNSLWATHLAEEGHVELHDTWNV
jgi:hypothetical protein